MNITNTHLSDQNPCKLYHLHHECSLKLLTPKGVADKYNAYGGNHARTFLGLDILKWHFCNRLVNKYNSDFYRNMISNNSDNPRQLWNCITRIIHRKASVSLQFVSRDWRIRSPKFMLLSKHLPLVVRLNFQSCITHAGCLNEPHVLKLINWFYHDLISPVTFIIFLYLC